MELYLQSLIYVRMVWCLSEQSDNIAVSFFCNLILWFFSMKQIFLTVSFEKGLL